MKEKHNSLPIIAGIVTSSIFGLSFLFSKRALNVAGPYELLSFRFILAFLVMTALIFLKVIKIDYKGKNIKSLLMLGILQPIIYFIFETYGIKYSSSSQAGLMIALIPICVTVMSSYFLKEKPSAVQIVFIVLSVAGVMFIVVMGGSGSGSSTLLGTLLLVGAVLSGAAFTILSRKLSKEFSPMELTYSMMGLATVFFTTVSIINHIIEGNMNSYFAPLGNIDFLISIGYLGILSSIIAFFLINFTLSKIEATKSAVLANVSTVVSIVAGVIFLKEIFYFYHVIGSVMIITGVWGTNYFGAKKIVEVQMTNSQ